MSLKEIKNNTIKLKNSFNLLSDKEKCLKCLKEFFNNIKPIESNKYIYSNGVNFTANLVFYQIDQH
ncbi:MAG: hypothetical protein ACFE8A_09035 [Candidatus Hodarchaeota archaeon]